MGHFSHPGKDLGKIRRAAAAQPKKSLRRASYFPEKFTAGYLIQNPENPGEFRPYFTD
jgi:hypothetical protein